MGPSAYFTMLLIIIAVIALYLGITVGTAGFPGATVVGILVAFLFIAAMAGIFIVKKGDRTKPDRVGDKLP
jgi:hypothetical protein